MLPMLSRAGYPERFSLGLLTSSGSLGLLFPPSLAILLYGIVAGVNIDELFLAGLVPGLLLLVILILYSGLVGKRAGVPRQAFSWSEARQALRMGIWDLLLPVLVVAGIFGGFVTVAEAAACTGLYVLILESFIHRTLDLRRQLMGLLSETTLLVGSILIILGVAMGLTNLLIDAQLPTRILGWMEGTVDSKLKFLLLLNVFLLIVGATMDIFSATVVVVPLLLPLALLYGVDPVHLGILFLANMEIGYSTPPVGLNLYIAMQRFRRSILTLFRSVLPFLGLMLLWLGLVTYVPALSLWWK
jgi:tripartite ATP-independent transporter DctM subunit